MEYAVVLERLFCRWCRTQASVGIVRRTQKPPVRDRNWLSLARRTRGTKLYDRRYVVNVGVELGWIGHDKV